MTSQVEQELMKKHSRTREENQGLVKQEKKQEIVKQSINMYVKIKEREQKIKGYYVIFFLKHQLLNVVKFYFKKCYVN